MKKTKFYILVMENGKTATRRVDGYADYICGLPIGLHKTAAGWTVSELSTGLAIRTGRTRAAALENARPLFDRVSENLLSDKFVKARKVISAAYAG